MTEASLVLPAGAPLAPPQEDAWAQLDDADAWQRFSRALPDGRWESFLAIEGMFCAACSLAVEQALAPLPGVDEVQVSAASETARLVWNPERTQPSRWLAALRRAGYGAAPAGDASAAQRAARATRMLLWRWLVAGFCMMQVMMYAAPAYLAGPGEIASDAQALLRWASWMLTVPVLLFSCWPFYASAWRDLRRGRLGMDVPVALGIAIAFAASTVATFDPVGPLGAEVWYDSVTMFVFFLLSGRLLEQRLRGRTAGALRALARRLPDSTLRKDPADGQFRRVPVHRLRAGDVVRVLPGETFAADGTVEAGESRVDEALLTGESLAQARTVGDAVVAGSHNLSGTLEVRVSSAGNATRYAAIMALMERAAVDKPRLARIADRWAGPFLLGVLAASAASAAWWWGEGPARAVGVAIAVLVVTCPCALSLATPAATLAAAGALARRGVLVRSLRALEGGAAVDTVLFDKTGTLTEDRMAVAAVRTRQGVAPAQALGLAALLARQSLHPLSRAIAAAAGAGDSAVPGAVAAVQEIAGQGVEALHSEGGAIPQRLRLGSAGFCQAPASQHGGPQVHLADGQGWLASFELEEALRPDAAALLQRLNEAGIAFEILSGDSAHAVQHVAARLGVECARGGQSPQDKLARVQALQAQGHRVAMVGDGMNDGPVLARANLSIAMGQGVPVAQASADVVVPGGQLSSIDLLLRQAGRTRAVVRQNLLWAVVYNAACVPLAVLGWMPPWLAGLGMAASSLLVVANSARLARLPARRPQAD